MPLTLVTSLAHVHAHADTVAEARLRADLAERLRRACADMPPERFEALVDDIHATKLRWHVQETLACRAARH